MSEKKYLDNNGLLFFWTQIKNMFATKAQGGKADSAVQSVKITGSDDEYKNGTNVVLPAYPTVPTNVSEFTNDKQYQTAGEVSAAITAAVGGISGVAFVKLEDSEYNESGVPIIEGAAGKIYLTKNNGSAPNRYDEYIWLDEAFEKIGTTDIDLSGYVLSSDLSAITNTEIDTILQPDEKTDEV
jgi:hypothetical protein